MGKMLNLRGISRASFDLIVAEVAPARRVGATAIDWPGEQSGVTGGTGV